MDGRWRIQRLDSTPSTNDDIRRAALRGEREGMAVTALRQTAGRGRQGRVWESPEGNLYCSALLRPKNMPAVAGFYSFVAALAVRDAVSAFLPKIAVSLKWPNDVLAGDRKISGILLEITDDALIVGIGINVAHFPENTLYPATSLRAEGGKAELGKLLDILLERLGAWHDLMQAAGFNLIRTNWLAHAKTGVLTAKLPGETLVGTFNGIDPQGRLRLMLEDGAERAISTGDVVLGNP